MIYFKLSVLDFSALVLALDGEARRLESEALECDRLKLTISAKCRREDASRITGLACRLKEQALNVTPPRQNSSWTIEELLNRADKPLTEESPA